MFRFVITVAAMAAALTAPAVASAASDLTVTSLAATGTGPVAGGTAHRNEYTLTWALGSGESWCELRATSSVNSTTATSGTSTSASGSVLAIPGETLTFTLRYRESGDTCSQTLTTTATALAYAPEEGGGGGDTPPLEPEPAPTGQPPAASMTATFAGLLATFTDTSTDPDGDIVTVSWSFGNGANALATAGAVVDHLYRAAGSYVIIQTVIDATGLVSQTSYEITVAAFGGSGLATQRLSGRLTRAAVRADVGADAVYCSTGVRSLTVVGSGQVGLGRGTCRTLERLLSLRPRARAAEAIRRPGAIARALVVLGHEAAHARGVVGEREATCAAVPQVRRIASALGLWAKAATRVAATARAQTSRAKCAALSG